MTAAVDTTEATPLEAPSPFVMRVNLSRDVPENLVKEALASGDVGFLHSFTTGSAVDGPGIRVVAWTAGCHWRCQYCHNPDTWSMSNGMAVPLAVAVEELRKYRHGLKVMHGGFTLTGGEPLVQDRFAVKLLAAARKMGIHTALNSNGNLHERISDDEMRNVDLGIQDIKSWDAGRHLKLTGKEIGPTLDFARRWAALKIPIWLRLVVVPGLTDDPEDVAGIAKFAASLGNVQRVDVLPFHQMGRYKWEKLGLDYALHDTKPPSNELIQRVIAQFKAEGLRAC
jgi:pyruvate formate lyase activating enzyme